MKNARFLANIMPTLSSLPFPLCLSVSLSLLPIQITILFPSVSLFPFPSCLVLHLYFSLLIFIL